MPHLLLLLKVSVIFFLVPADECRQVSESAESKLLKGLANARPIESKLLPFLYKQQASKSLDRPQISSPTYKSAATTLSELLEPSIYSKGQESSWYLQESHSKNPPLSPKLNSIPTSESPKPQLSNLVVPLDSSLEYQTAWTGDALSNTVPFTKGKLTVCELKKKLLGRAQSSVDELNDKKFLVQVLSTNYENPAQRQSSRTRPKKIKIRLKKNDPSQLAKEWYGSQNINASLATKKRSTVKKLKIFQTQEQEMKFRQLKLKVNKPKKAKKAKIYSARDAQPLNKSWNNRGVISSRKSKTLRCYKTRKQDDNSSRTVCVTYPASWGEGANYTIPNGTPYPYYYPYYYYPAYYYYPYYVYG